MYFSKQLWCATAHGEICIVVHLCSSSDKLCSTCIKWGLFVSRVFNVDCGVRQGAILSPYLFALYIDSIVDRVRNSRIGCYLKGLDYV